MNSANILQTIVAFAAAASLGACASTPSDASLLAPVIETRLVEGGASPARDAGNDYLVLAERSWDSEERALENYAKALEVNGQNAFAYFKRGEIFKGRGEYDRAIDEFRMATEADPGFAYAFISLAHLSMDEESLESAETYVNRAVGINPEISEARMLRASIRLHMDQQDEAMEDLQYVTEYGSKSDRASAFMELGGIKFYNGDVEAALVEYRAAIDANPEDTWGYVAAAEALAKSGQLDEAIEVLEVGVSASWDPSWASTEIARVLVDMGRYEAAFGRVTQVLGEEPGRIDSLGVRGHAHLGLGRFDDAIADFERFIEQNEWDSWTRSEFGRALLRVGRIDEAEDHFATAIDLWWENIYARAGLSEVAETRGRFAAAADEIRTALEMAPENGFLLLRAATLLERGGSSEEAAEMLARIERIDDDQIHRFNEYRQHNPESRESVESVIGRLTREQQGRFQ